MNAKRKISVFNKVFMAVIMAELILCLLLLYYKHAFGPGLTAFVVNNSDKALDVVEFAGRNPEGDLLIADILPGEAAKGYHEFKYLEGTAMFYQNKDSEEIIIPVMYVFNPKSNNVVIITINSIDGEGNIIDYEVENSFDHDVFFKAIWLNLLSSR